MCDSNTDNNISTSCITTDSDFVKNNLHIELNNMIIKRKNKEYYLDSDINNISEKDVCDNKSDDLIKVISEMRVDILHILIILQKLVDESNCQKQKILNLENKLKSSECISSKSSECISSTSQELNDNEIKMDKFKKEVNTEFTEFRNLMNSEFLKFKQNIIDISRIQRKC